MKLRDLTGQVLSATCTSMAATAAVRMALCHSFMSGVKLGGYTVSWETEQAGKLNHCEGFGI